MGIWDLFRRKAGVMRAAMRPPAPQPKAPPVRVPIAIYEHELADPAPTVSIGDGDDPTRGGYSLLPPDYFRSLHAAYTPTPTAVPAIKTYETTSSWTSISPSVSASSGDVGSSYGSDGFGSDAGGSWSGD